MQGMVLLIGIECNDAVLRDCMGFKQDRGRNRAMESKRYNVYPILQSSPTLTI